MVYAISLHIHIFLQSCINARGPSDVPFLTFTNLQSSIVFRNLSTILPMSFQWSVKPTSKRKNNNDNNKDSKRAKQKGSTDHVHGDPVHNTRPAHPDVLKFSGESFHDYYKHLEVYDDEGMKKGACLKWHIGRCNSKCRHSASHGPLTPDLVTSVQKFANECHVLNK